MKLILESTLISHSTNKFYIFDTKRDCKKILSSSQSLFILQVYSPDCQAFVHNVGSTDSKRIKDILWLYKIPLFKSTSCKQIQGRSLNSSLRIQFLTMPAHRAIFKLCFAYCSYIILCSNNSLNYKFAITLKYLCFIIEVSYKISPYLLSQPIPYIAYLFYLGLTSNLVTC